MPDERRAEFLRILKRTYLFTALEEKELLFIIKHMKFISLPAGAELCASNTPGDICYFIISGRVKIEFPLPHGGTNIRYLHQGEAVGEAVLLTGERYPATAKTDTDSELLSLHRNDFEIILQMRPNFSYHFSKLLFRRLSDFRMPGNLSLIHI